METEVLMGPSPAGKFLKSALREQLEDFKLER